MVLSTGDIDVFMSAELLYIRDIDSGAPSGSIGRRAGTNSQLTSLVQQICQCLAMGALAVGSYFLVSRYVFQSVEVSGASMSPTLQNSDHYFLNRWSYNFRAPLRGEIVVVKDPTDGAYCVKRVVGLPGESLYFSNGRLFINGRELREPYLPKGTKTFLPAVSGEELVTCGKDDYFVLGDNRSNSFDSRFYGPIARANILGVVMR
jgi:signal peptidase I